jgi:hypothetical protein
VLPSKAVWRMISGMTCFADDHITCVSYRAESLADSTSSGSRSGLSTLEEMSWIARGSWEGNVDAP